MTSNKDNTTTYRKAVTRSIANDVENYKINMRLNVHDQTIADVLKSNEKLRKRLTSVEGKFNAIQMIISPEPKKKPPSKSERCLEIGLTSLLQTSFHGLPHIMRQRHKAIQAMWIVVLLVSVCACAAFIVFAIMNFCNREVFTRFQLIEANQSILPAFTLCLAKSKQTSLDQFLISCHQTHKNCTTSDWEQIDLIDLAAYKNAPKKCYTINGAKPTRDLFYSTEIGYKSGFMFVFLLPEKDFLNFYVHDNRIKPVLSELGRVIRPGFETNLILTKEVVNKLPDPYNECLVYENNQNIRGVYSEYFKRTIANNMTYNRISCLEMCESEFIFERCNSSMQSYFQSECIRSGWKQLKAELDNHCLTQCPIECYTISFRIETELIDWKFLSPQIDLSYVRSTYGELANKSDADIFERVLSVNVFYESFHYSYVSESPAMTIIDLIGSAGGILGLYLGISLVSFVEIFEVAVEILFIYLS